MWERRHTLLRSIDQFSDRARGALSLLFCIGSVERNSMLACANGGRDRFRGRRADWNFIEKDTTNLFLTSLIHCSSAVAACSRVKDILPFYLPSELPLEQVVRSGKRKHASAGHVFSLRSSLIAHSRSAPGFVELSKTASSSNRPNRYRWIVGKSCAHLEEMMVLWKVAVRDEGACRRFAS